MSLNCPRVALSSPAMRSLCCAVTLLGLVSCASTSNSQVPVPPLSGSTKPMPVCLVLSMGAEAGLSHIGVIRAVRERGVPIDCVVGTSMGALVGGLFSANPNIDVSHSYRDLASRYEQKARAEGSNAALLGLLLGGAMLASGGGSFLVGGLAGAGLGAATVSPMEWERLRGVLREQQDGATIELLPVRFASVHQTLTTTGATSEAVSGGLLADAVARSIANPLLFTDLEAKPGKSIDPGLDRVSSVPVEAACSLFPGHQLLVSKVVDQAIYTSSAMTCPYQEIVVPPLAVDVTTAMSAHEPEFSQLVDSGYQAAQRQVNWGLLPDNSHPPAWSMATAPVFHVRATLSVEVAPTKPSGGAWDIFGGLPDIEHNTSVSICEGCEAFGTSASVTAINGKREDTMNATWDLGVLHLRPGMWLNVAVRDADVSEHDPIGEFKLVFDGVSPEAHAANEVARVSVRFEDGAR